MAKISVCIATYNGESFLKDQLNSIIPQLAEFDEIIISDDNSIDKTVDIINEFSDKRIKLFYNNEKGYVSNFENALRQISGDVIILSDQDDIWADNKVKVCLEALSIHDFVVSDCKMINHSNEVISDSYYESRNVKKTFLGNLIKFSYLGCCFAFKSTILKKALPFPPNRQLCTHDNWIFLVGTFFFKYKILNDKLIFYRRHNGNVSTGGLISKMTALNKIKYRVYLCFFLLKVFFYKSKV